MKTLNTPILERFLKEAQPGINSLHQVTSGQLIAVDKDGNWLFVVVTDKQSDTLGDCCIHCIGKWQQQVESEFRACTHEQFAERYEFTAFGDDSDGEPDFDFDDVVHFEAIEVTEGEMYQIRRCPICDEILDFDYCPDDALEDLVSFRAKPSLALSDLQPVELWRMACDFKEVARAIKRDNSLAEPVNLILMRLAEDNGWQF